MSVIAPRSELDIELFTTLQLCEIINSPRALAVKLLLEAREWSQYLELPMEPSHYDNVSSFRDDYLVTRILSKSPNLPLGVDRRAAAVDAFMHSETLCRGTNERLARSKDDENLLWRMSIVFGRLLPDISRSLDRILGLCNHGPGSTIGVRGVGGTVIEKYQKPVTLTANLLPFKRILMGELWYSNNLLTGKLVSGGRLSTVPKNCKTDRVINIEPLLNVYLQKGIGAFIRQRLLLLGLDLDTQTDRNRDLARRAYSEELCTIDLSSASDSISKVLVERLVPPEWYHLFMLARSPSTEVDGKTVKLEKISTMGNGFTFELESAIFYILCLVAIPKQDHRLIGVYGDDIVIPRIHADKVIAGLNYLGFSLNRAKTFLDGTFFESCGTDWFRGHLVRPFFLKGSTKSVPYPVQICNRLRTWCAQSGFGCDARFKRLWIHLVKQAPKIWRMCRIPEFLGDVGIMCSEGELYLMRKETSGAEGYSVKAILSRPVKRRYDSFGYTLDAIAVIGKQDTPGLGFRPVRGYLRRPIPRWTLINEWPCGLEWDSMNPL